MFLLVTSVKYYTSGLSSSANEMNIIRAVRLFKIGLGFHRTLTTYVAGAPEV
jgi:hypothetical protein